MKQNAFYEIFIDQLRHLFDGENQITENLPNLIQMVNNLELKEALNQWLDETKTQTSRLKKIFSALNENPTGERCLGIRGLMEEWNQVANKARPALSKDAYLIICFQKVAHYEIASYGSARAIANHLSHCSLDNQVDFDEIANLLQQTLDEEASIDNVLTDIAEGGFFTKGINDNAEKEEYTADQR